MRARRCVVSLVWSTLVIAAASLAPTLQAQFVYVANQSSLDTLSATVSAFSIAATGELTPIGPPVATGVGPRGLSVDPTEKFLYVANARDNTVSAFSIGAARELTPIGTTPVGPAPATGRIIIQEGFGSGLQTIQLVSAINSTVNISPFVLGTTESSGTLHSDNERDTQRAASDFLGERTLVCGPRAPGRRNVFTGYGIGDASDSA